MESASQAPHRTASRLWYAIAVVLFAMSAALTFAITRVEHGPAQLGYAIFLGGRSAHPPDIQFERSDGHLTLNVVPKPDASQQTLIFGPVARGNESAVTCADGAGRPIPTNVLYTVGSTGKTANVHRELGLPMVPWNANFNLDFAIYSKDEPLAVPFFGLDLSSAERSAQGEKSDAVACDLPDVTVHDTFTTRALTVVVGRSAVLTSKDQPAPPQAPAALAFYDPLSIAVRSTDQRDARIALENTGEAMLGSMVGSTFLAADRDPTDATFTFSWESVNASAVRDIYIVVIGSLIALGAAAVIEGIRPSIEAFRDRSRPEA